MYVLYTKLDLAYLSRQSISESTQQLRTNHLPIYKKTNTATTPARAYPSLPTPRFPTPISPLTKPPQSTAPASRFPHQIRK